MTQTVYQTTIKELESVLNPRVVSRSLNEGLKQIGKTPETVSFQDIEKILKAHVYKQLQVTMPVTLAKNEIIAILNRIKATVGDSAIQAQASAESSQQKKQLDIIKEALKPFNLYFEWPEVQKLRAQVQLLESDREAGRDLGNLLLDANTQLEIVKQKLEDSLVAQARDLGEVQSAFEQVKILGGPKIRRLENLIHQIESAQEGRQLAPAEIERARKLASDLRKLMESSVASDAMLNPEPAPIDVESSIDGLLTIDTETLSPEVTERLLMIDLEEERHSLNSLESEFKVLLTYDDGLLSSMLELHSELDAQHSIAEQLVALRESLQQRRDEQRQRLQKEIQALKTEANAFIADAPELAQALQVTLGVLETGLPPKADVAHVHNLFALAKTQHEKHMEEQSSVESEHDLKLAEQAAILARIDKTLARYKNTTVARDEYDDLMALRHILENALQLQEVNNDILIKTQRAEVALESAIAEQAQAVTDKQQALIRNLLAQVQALPASNVESLSTSRDAIQEELNKQLTELEKGALADEQLSATTALVENLKSRVRGAFQDDLAALIDRARNLANRALLGDLQTAVAQLDEEHYPDLKALTRSVKQAEEAQRTEQLAELHQIAQQAAAYTSVEPELAAQLTQLIQEAQANVEQGQLSDTLDTAWHLLEQLRSLADNRASDFIPRLDAALTRFDAVTKLNSDEVATLRRTLAHLDKQRDAFAKVSVGVQSQLELSLSEVESVLEQLEQELEATQAIADQLVSGNVLDGLLGIFSDAPATEAEPVLPSVSEPVAEPELTDIRSDNQALNRWINSYLMERGVRDVALFDAAGALLAGRLRLDVAAFSNAVKQLDGDVQALGDELGLHKRQLVTMELKKHVLVLAWPTPQVQLMLLLDQPSLLSMVLHKLRQDMPEMTASLYGIKLP